MLAVLGLLGRSPAFTGVLIMALVGALAWGGIQTWRIGTLENEVREAENKQERAEQQTQACRDQMSVQNERIQDLSDDRKFRDGMIDMLRENIDTERERTQRTITSLIDAPVPENCEAAIQFLRDGLGDFK
jgi:chromosome segregation ATPase